MRPLTAAVLGKAVATLVLGLVVGAVGTVMHRWHEPWGVVACLALVVAAAVTSRAWAGWPTWIAYAGGVFFAVQALSQTGPGGDVLIPSGQVIGWVWVIGSIGLALVIGLLPARLFRDKPRGRRRATSAVRVAPELPAAQAQPPVVGQSWQPGGPGPDEPGR
ncbi:MAG TPA: hypothetical protein VGC04_02380 [Cellulomonas sp.]